MGAENLFAAQSALTPFKFPSFFFTPSGNLAASNAQGAGSLKSLLGGNSKDVDSLCQNTELQTEEAFNALVYRSQMEKASLSVRLENAAARVTGTGEDGQEGSVEMSAQQLTFDFFAESRTEELMVFQSRTSDVADKLSGAQQETYIEASRQVATRFSMSISVSGAVLSGFSKASEGLPSASPATFDDFQSLVDDALAQADDVLNKIFELLGDFFSNEGADLETRLADFVNGLKELGLFGGSTESAGLPAENGTAVTVKGTQFSMQLEFQFEQIEMVQVKSAAVQESDPIILDLDGDGYDLTSYKNGARFDITGKGQAATTAFVTGGDAFLAIDRNGNGTIDSGKELFGDQNGAANGFEELRKLDSNGDGRINKDDKDFAKLRLWKDNGNGITEEGELISLANAGIQEISLGYKDVKQVAAGGNRIAQIASFIRTDGTRGGAADAILNYTV